ncbi:unnamed protein product [Closterium sp. Yama58-4]|nr:unnamed protein product [Closterium sp. Yama58-4]
MSKRKKRLVDLTPEEINEIVALRGKLPQAVVGKRFGIEQTDVSQIQRQQKGKLMRADDKARPCSHTPASPFSPKTVLKADSKLIFPLTSLCALWAADNGDLGSVVKKVVFQLHPSFSNPTRIVERPPFMLSESGWGEFEIAMTIVFHADASEMPAELTHHLRLYPEGSAPNQPLSTKRPVVAEEYDELVFCEPQIAFFHRIRSNPMVRIHGSEEAITAAGNHAAIPRDGSSSAPADARSLESDLRGENRGDTLDHPLSQWFLQFSDEQELTAIAAARKQVATLTAKLEAEYASLESECQELKQGSSVEWQPPAQDPPGYVNPFDESAARGGSSSGAFPAGLFDDGNRVLKIKDAEFIMAPLHTACETLAAKVVEPTLDCLQKMVAHQHLRGEMDVGGTTRESKLLTRVMESVCKCYDIADEAVELLVLKTMLSAVTSTSLRVHGECVLKAVRTCYNIYLGSKVPVNQTTAKASLTQMLVIVFRRMEADSSTVPVQPIVVADLMEPSDRLASDQNVTQFVQSFITKVVQDIEVAFNPAHTQSLDDGAFDLAVAPINSAATDGSLVEDKDMLDVKYWDVNMLAGSVTDPAKTLGGDGKVVTVKAGATAAIGLPPGAVAAVPVGSSANGGGNPAGTMAGGGVIIPDVDPEKEGESEVKITNKLRRDAFLVFRALCKLSMKAPPAEGVVDPFAVRGKVVSLELLKICLENSGAVFRTNERFVGAVKQYLCLSLLKNCTSSLMSVFQLSCSIFFSLLTRFRSVLKAEIGVFFPMIVLRVLENVAHANFQQKMIVLRFLERLCVDPQILVDIFANYDCDVESTVSIFERMVSGLLKTAQGVPPGADSTLNAAQDQQLRLAAIKCMVGVLRSMGSWTNRQLCVTAGPKVAAEIGAAAAAAAASAAATAAAAAAAAAAGEGGVAASVAVPDLLSGDLLPDFVNPRTGVLPVAKSEEALEEEALGGLPGVGANSVGSGNEISEAAILEQRRAYKLELQEGMNLFNKKPKKGIDFLIKAKKLGESAEEIVAFLRKTEGLDKTMIGDFLGDRDDMSIKIMHAYMDSYNLSGMDFDEAIRAVLLGFRLPGEAQKIDRIMEKFAERYCRCNPKAFTSADTAYVLAYSVIMLNTDAHNPGVKTKMSKADFLKNNRGIDDGKDIPEEFLGGLYDRITRNEIKMKPEILGPGGVVSKAAVSSAAGNALLGLESILNLMSGRTRATTELETSDEVVKHMQEQFRAKAGKSGSVFYAASDVQIIRPMVDVVWAPMLAAFSVPLETTEEEAVTEQCLEGFRYAVHVTAVIGMQMQRDAFVTSLAKFTSLHSAADIKQKNVDAIKSLLLVAEDDGNYLQDAWEHVLTCVSRYEHLHLIGEGAPTDSHFFSAAPQLPPLTQQQRPQPLDPQGKRGGGRGVAASVYGGGEGRGVVGGGQRDSGTPRGSAGDAGTPRGQAKRFGEGGDAPAWKNVSGKLNQVEKLVRRGSYDPQGMIVGGPTGVGVGVSLSHLSPDQVQLLVANLGLLEQVGSDEVSRLFSRSERLNGQAIVEFVKALCKVSLEELRSPTEPRVFSLTKIVEIAHFVTVECMPNLSVAMYAIDSLRQLAMKFLEREELSNHSFQNDHFNMSRIRLVWSRIWAVLADYFVTVGCMPNLSVAMYAIDSLRQLAMKFLERKELINYNFQNDHFNMSRIRLVWSRIWAVLADYFVTVGCMPNLSVAMYAIDSLRQLAMKFLEREELSNYNFQNEFLKPFVVVMRRTASVEIRELIIRCVSQMVFARVGNVKSGWKIMFMVFTTAATDDNKNIVLLAFETIEKVVREYFPYITETETTTFTDCVNCLIAFTNSRFNKDVSLNAIAFLRFCALKLAEGDLGASALEREKGLSPSQVSHLPGHPDGEEFTDKDDHLYFWFPLLAGLSELTFDPRPDIRKSALEVLFDTLRFHGHMFSAALWERVFESVLFPIFDYGAPLSRHPSTSEDERLRAARSGSPDPVSELEMDAWLYETCTLALQLVVDLFVKFYSKVSPLLGKILALLTSFIRRPHQSLAAIGVAAFVRLMSNAGGLFSEEKWDEVLTALKETTGTTLPDLAGVVKAADLEDEEEREMERQQQIREARRFDFTRDEDEEEQKQQHQQLAAAVAEAVGAAAGGGGGAEGGDGREEGGLEVKRPMTLAEAVADVRCKIAVQLLLVQAMTEIFSMHGAALSAPHTLILLDSLHRVGTHAHAINSDRLLRSRLQALHLATQMPDPPLLRLESEALHAYLSLLQRLPREKAQLAKEVDVELRLVILCEEVLRVYVGTSQGKLALMTEDPRGPDAPPLPPIPLAVPLGSARRRELVARAPLVVATLQAVTALKDAAFKKHLARFFPLLADLVSSEHGSPEIQVALSKMFSSRIGPIVFSVAE